MNHQLFKLGMVGDRKIVASHLRLTRIEPFVQLSTKVYRKPTHTERYLSFDSHHPAAHKRAVVKSLTDRAGAIPSPVDQQSKEMKHVITALKANGFDIHASKPKRPSQQTLATAPDDKKGFCILPYVKGTTEPIKRILGN